MNQTEGVSVLKVTFNRGGQHRAIHRFCVLLLLLHVEYCIIIYLFKCKYHPMDLPFSLLFRKWSTWFRFYIEQFFVVFVSLFLYPKKEHLFISHNQPIVNMYRIRHQMCNSTSYFSNIVASVSFVFVLVVRSLDMSQSDL